MVRSRRPPAFFHCTPEPLRFFGRDAELSLLDQALHENGPSIIALIGPGGQGKTAIVRHWLESASTLQTHLDGCFFWSFYRGKDSDLCLRELFGYAEGLGKAADVSASFAVDRLIPILRRERWAIVLDGAEVVQHETGAWSGRFLHPELGRLLEEVASAPMPGVVALTTRFAVPTLDRRPWARIISLTTLDVTSACQLLKSLGVCGTESELEKAARSSGLHAKAVELLGTYLVRFHGARATNHQQLPSATDEGAGDEERQVLRILAAFQQGMDQESKDILALATAFRQPPAEEMLLDYLLSKPVERLLQEVWRRDYVPFSRRLRETAKRASTRRVDTETSSRDWLKDRLQELIDLRLLERVHLSLEASSATVLDAHPLVRRGFEVIHGQAQARAGFLRGRPDRQAPASLEEARDEVELFHAYCDAGLWNEADSTYVALDNPKHRFLAPAFERDLLASFFPEGDWRRPPLWSGFGRFRSLAIALEMLGQYEDALNCYRGDDWPLRGDALIALGRLQPFLDHLQAPHPWQPLWQAYRAHALALMGRREEALAIARSLVPQDIYEWVHVFECLLRLNELKSLDLPSLLYRPPLATEHRWSKLARRRMRADYLRLIQMDGSPELANEYADLTEAYDRGGLAWERTLTRLSWSRYLTTRGEDEGRRRLAQEALELARRHALAQCIVDALALLGEKNLHRPLRP